MSDYVMVRPIEPADKAQWRVLWTAYLEFYESSVSEAVYEATFDRLCSHKHPNQKAFVAVKG